MELLKYTFLIIFLLNKMKFALTILLIGLVSVNAFSIDMFNKHHIP